MAIENVKKTAKIIGRAKESAGKFKSGQATLMA
jgi:hypothetical protein